MNETQESDYNKDFEELSPRNESENVNNINNNNPEIPVDMVTTPREMEQQIRDEIENRLHQLEHMLVNSEETHNLTKTGSVHELHHSPTGKNNANSLKNLDSPYQQTQDEFYNDNNNENQSPFHKTAEQIAEEEKATQQYKERKLKAKKRREEKQQKEMQKILDEKKQMEEELEELKQSLMNEKLQNQQQQAIEQQQRRSRPSTTTAPQQSNNAFASPSADGAEDEMDDFAAKKLARLKKRYEKKLTSAKEELEALRDVRFCRFIMYFRSCSHCLFRIFITKENN
jgi:hypothetical protein